MEIEVLISTMNLKEQQELLKKMNILTKSIIINQCNSENKLKNEEKGDNKLYNYMEKGLSRSRNQAIKHSTGDICVIADDDIKYDNNYEKTIKKAYDKYKDADVIAFYIKNGKPKMKEGKINFVSSMKIQSVQLTFKRKSILKNNIMFNELFGTGAELYMGEENIFLAECIRKGLKIYYVPESIAEVENGNSTWFKGYNEQYFKIKGTVYYEMSRKLYPVLILQFALRKMQKYASEVKPTKAIKYMFEGVKNIKKRSQNESSFFLQL